MDFRWRQRAVPKSGNETYLSVHNAPSIQHPTAQSGDSPRRTRRTGFKDGWLAEILCLALSIAAVAALVAILAIYNGRPLASLGTSTSVNVIISVLVTIAEFALVYPAAEALGQQKWMHMHAANNGRPLKDLERFEKAGRDAFAAFALFAHAGRLNMITLLGAVVMILHLFIGPFTQQAISYPLRLAPLPSTAFQSADLARAQDYTRTWNGSIVYNRMGIALKVALDAPLTNVTVDPSYLCSSGNCTWAPFGSLGVGSKCVDVTESLRMNYSNGMQPIPPWADKDDSDDPLWMTCNISFPTGFETASTAGSTNYVTDNVSYTLGNVPTVYGPAGYNFNATRLSATSLSSELVQFIDLPDNFSLANADQSSLGELGLYFGALESFHVGFASNATTGLVTRSPWGTQCAFYLNVQTYGITSVSNGQLQQAVVENEWTVDGGLDYDDQRIATLQPERDGAIYHRSNSSIAQIGANFAYIFNVVDGSGNTGSPPWYLAQVYGQKVNGDDNATERTLDNRMAQYLAQAATNTMRTYADGEIFATGVTLTPTVFIHVEWAWLTVAFAVLLMAVVFVGMTMWQNKRKRYPL